MDGPKANCTAQWLFSWKSIENRYTYAKSSPLSIINSSVISIVEKRKSTKIKHHSIQMKILILLNLSILVRPNSNFIFVLSFLKNLIPQAWIEMYLHHAFGIEIWFPINWIFNGVFSLLLATFCSITFEFFIICKYYLSCTQYLAT